MNCLFQGLCLGPKLRPYNVLFFFDEKLLDLTWPKAKTSHLIEDEAEGSESIII